MNLKKPLMSAKRFLIINPYGIGDVLFTIPMIKNLAANFPDAFIGYIANRRTAPLLESVPQIHKLTIYDRGEFKSVWDSSRLKYFKLLQTTIQEIKDGRYDIAFDLSLTWYASFYGWFSGIPERIGLNYKNRSPFLTKKIPFSGFKDRHVVEYYLDLLPPAGLSVNTQTMEIPLESKARAWALDFFEKTGLNSKNWIAVFPGCGESWGEDAKSRRWPAAKHALLINKIRENFNVNIMLMGNQQEESLCNEVQSLVKYPLYNLCGSTNLLQTLAILKYSLLAIVNDGGPLHMAVASGTKTVSVFGPVDENVYGPYLNVDKRHRVVASSVFCRPCYRNFRRARCEHTRCIKDIDVDDVFCAVKDSLT